MGGGGSLYFITSYRMISTISPDKVPNNRVLLSPFYRTGNVCGLVSSGIATFVCQTPKPTFHFSMSESPKRLLGQAATGLRKFAF